jgi:hypothetical protein
MVKKRGCPRIVRPEATALARQLREEGCSLRQISRELFARGYTNRTGKPLSQSSVNLMLERIAEPVNVSAER